MIIDLRKIIRSGKTEENFFFEYEPKLDVDIPDGEILLPVKLNGKAVVLTRHSVYIECELCFSVKGSCTRCLKPVVKDYVVKIEEVAGEAEDGYPVKNDTVDLSQIADDKILTTIPVSFLCDEDCKGLCPKCGQNLNDGDCECK